MKINRGDAGVFYITADAKELSAIAAATKVVQEIATRTGERRPELDKVVSAVESFLGASLGADSSN